jgi:methionyl aminopeptidase
MLGRNDPCWCGSGKKWKKCHSPDLGPKAVDALSARYKKSFGILIKSQEQIAGIRHACKIAAHILEKVALKAKAGMTTNDLNAYAEELHKEFHVTAAPLGYGHPPFPKSICTSKNEVICHGIPDDIPLQDGDIVNIDVTCISNGFYGDCSQMVSIGEISKEKQRVIDVSKECLDRSISILKPGVLVCQIGDVIDDYAKSMGCSVVDQFTGHGTGVFFHEEPQIPHNKNNLRIPLAAGMTFTIEPMINAGVKDAIIDQSDHWTARTADKRASAQWEHTVLITETGYEILTQL